MTGVQTCALPICFPVTISVVEIENFYYEMVTKRMSAEAAKEQAAAMVDKIAKDYELGKGHLDNENQKNLREWIYGGIDQFSDIIDSLSKFK